MSATDTLRRQRVGAIYILNAIFTFGEPGKLRLRKFAVNRQTAKFILLKFMKNISYNIPLITQNIQDCVQASAAQILQYYGIKKTIEEIKKEVPVYINKEGKLLGSSLGQIATYFVQLGLKTTIYTVDIEIFDRSWGKLDKLTLIKRLTERRKYLKHSRYDDDALDLVINGYVDFLKKGGQITMSIVDEAYLYKLLERGPIYAIVSYNFFNQVAKYKSVPDQETPVQDSIAGNPTTHAVVISGYSNGLFEVVDPDYEFGGKKKINPGQLIGAYYLAETDFDSMLITLDKHK